MYLKNRKLTMEMEVRKWKTSSYMLTLNIRSSSTASPHYAKSLRRLRSCVARLEITILDTLVHLSCDYWITLLVKYKVSISDLNTKCIYRYCVQLHFETTSVSIHETFFTLRNVNLVEECPISCVICSTVRRRKFLSLSAPCWGKIPECTRIAWKTFWSRWNK